MEKESMTLSELAKMLDTTRDKIIYRYKKLPRELWYKSEGIIYIKKDGIESIKADIEKNKKHSKPKETEEENIGNTSVEIFEDQLSKKDIQIAKLQQLLDQQQQLHLQANQRIETLEKEIALNAPKMSPETFYTKNDEIHEKEIKTPEIERERYLMNDEQKTILAYLKENYQVETLADIEQLEMPDKKWWQFWKRA